LSNNEISKLNKYAKFIVCPYTSASQSGIPLTTFLFNKPIIASNIGDFPNIVEQDKTGVLIQPNNRDQLMNAILKLVIDEKFYRMISANIKIKYSSGQNSWNSIADRTIDFYNIVHELSDK
jgi:glycosyltransferase involved in cell wall biosynthesis